MDEIVIEKPIIFHFYVNYQFLQSVCFLNLQIWKKSYIFYLDSACIKVQLFAEIFFPAPREKGKERAVDKSLMEMLKAITSSEE